MNQIGMKKDRANGSFVPLHGALLSNDSDDVEENWSEVALMYFCVRIISFLFLFCYSITRTIE